MIVHLVDYEYHNKNTPENVVEATYISGTDHSWEARADFWNHLDTLVDVEEVDKVRILHVGSSILKG